MNTIIHFLIAIITFALAVTAAVIAWIVFNFVHFIATDALNDVGQAREPVFRDYLHHSVLYIPVLLIGFFSVICAYLSYRSFKHLGCDQSSGRSEDLGRLGDNSRRFHRAFMLNSRVNATIIAMKQTTSTPIKGQGDLAPPQPKSPRRRIVLKICVLILALPMVFALILFRIYGVDTHHASRGSIWWPERGRNLIPPTASDITLRRDLLDHYATYTLSEKELNAFLDKRFARPGKALDSFSERSPAQPDTIGKVIGPLGWVVTENTVSYTYTASNGGAHNYYHDTKSGLTYQSSAYW